MKKFEIENVLNQKRISSHLAILLFSLIVMFINRYIDTEGKQWSYFLTGFLLIFTQIEVFIFLSHLIFKNINPGITPGEITRSVLSRFALFLLACLIAAFIIYISYSYIRQAIFGGDLSKVISDFFKYSFTGWFKSTAGGLSVGAVIFIIIMWQDALQREQKLREQNLIFQNETLKNQVNPHFLFNCLNTLSSLIETQPDTSRMFISRLSAIYRYILDNSNRDKVPLKSELAFVTDYFELHKIRDEEKIQLTINVAGTEQLWILPVSLQILLENAIKHNMATREQPLKISISTEGKYVIVRNNLQKMAVQLKSTKIGLKNLEERIRLVTGRALIIEENASEFTVKVPLIS